MPRIRTLKPEAFQSETLGSVSVEAERTFLGLTTQADDRGRHRDNAAVINGMLWSLRPEHTPVQLESELGELEHAGLICRYRGCDGKRYLHFVTWDSHQKIDRPSKSRQPKCAEHATDDDYCGKHSGDCPPASPRPDLDRPSRDSREGSMQDRGPWTVDRGPRTEDQRERAGASERDPEPPPPVQRPDGLTSLDAVAEPANVKTRAKPMSRTSGYPRQAQPPRDETSRESARGKESIPDDFELTDAMRRYAAGHFPQLDVDFETAQFVSHFRATGDRRRSWPDAWQKWLRDSAKRRSDQALRVSARASPNGALSRRQQADNELFDDAMQRARTRDAQEASGDP